MATKPDQTKNTTGTDLEVLQSLEQSWKKSKGDVKRNTQSSLTWFRNLVTKNWRDIRTARMFRDKSLWASPLESHIGKMYFYEYKAESVDFYDRFPLAIIINKYEKNGNKYITALNLHWLPPVLRQAAFVSLLKLRTEKRYRPSTRMKLEWKLLENMANHELFKHCVKSYRADRFKSVMVEIPAPAWELALFLPLQRFVGGDKAEAWKI